MNVKGVWIMSRAVIPHFQERGEGKIVNIASVAGRKGVSRFPNYSASKGGGYQPDAGAGPRIGAE